LLWQIAQDHIDGESAIMLMFGQRDYRMHGVYCYNLEGKELWQRDLGAYKMLMNWGTGSSPALDGDRLFILCDNEEKSFLVALDKKTGKDLWRVTHGERSNWTTPFVWRNQLRTEIVTAGSNAIRSYDPADGEVLWELRRPAASSMSYVNATPVASESMLYVAAGSKPGSSPLWAVKVGASGDISPKPGETSNAFTVWSSIKACPPMASPLLYKDNLYILMQNGILMCLDAKTGKQLYKERLIGAKSLTSSPWAHDGKVYCLDEDGQTFVVEAGPKFELLGKNQIKDMFWATPALSEGSLYLRGADRLWCIRQQAADQPGPAQ
jgi:outer membrane protein assembly factor BamB